MATGLGMPGMGDSYQDAQYVEGYYRYPEALMMIDNAFKEQQYWVSMYNKAQQFGLRGYTVQEITNQMQKVSQRLKNLQQIYLPFAERQLTQFNIAADKNTTELIKQSF